jgi:phosphonopyruvate decarboxylase
MLLLVGWRGQPGVKDEPQHVKQGRVMGALFEAMDIPQEILDTENKVAAAQVARMLELARQGKRPVALIVRKGTFKKYTMHKYEQNQYFLSREEAIVQIATLIPQHAVIVASTGQISRELYEYRERERHDHARDFLTVGSMGHASQIALGIALVNPARSVYCLDGDGALLMHLGAMPLIGQSRCHNMRHIVLNNGVHGSVGGQPTGALGVSFVEIAKACGYASARLIDDLASLNKELITMNKVRGPSFLEIKVSASFRKDLGRPKTTPLKNKEAFMKYLDKDFQKKP